MRGGHWGKALPDLLVSGFNRDPQRVARLPTLQSGICINSEYSENAIP